MASSRPHRQPSSWGTKMLQRYGGFLSLSSSEASTDSQNLYLSLFSSTVYPAATSEPLADRPVRACKSANTKTQRMEEANVAAHEPAHEVSAASDFASFFVSGSASLAPHIRTWQTATSVSGSLPGPRTTAHWQGSHMSTWPHVTRLTSFQPTSAVPMSTTSRTGRLVAYYSGARF